MKVMKNVSTMKSRDGFFAVAAVSLCAAVLPALAETWTFNGSGTSDANYATANAWKNESNANVTFDESTTSPRTYVVPAGKTLVTPNTTGVSWRFTANEGDVFTLQGASSAQASLLSRVSTLTVPLLVLGDNARFKFDRHSTAATHNQELLGSVRVDASAEHPASIVFEGFWDTQFTNATTVTGSGALVYAQNPVGGSRGYLRLNWCDASAFTGPVTLTIGKGGADTTRTPTIYISSADNIGGNPPEFLEKGLALSGVNFNIGGNVTLPANRGLYSLKPETESDKTSPSMMNDTNWAGPNRIDVSSSRTFTIQRPIGFEDDAQEYPLTKWGGGTMRVPGWASGGWLNLGNGTLDITGASVSEGAVTSATIGKLTINGTKTVKLTLSGDGSSLADGRYVLLSSAARLPEGFATLVTVVNSGAFTLPSGKKAMYSVANGTDFIMTVKDNVETWTYNGANDTNPRADSDGVGGNQAANYAAANVWKDANGANQTFDTAATVARDYIIPAGKMLVSELDTDNNAGEWRFTGNNDTFILRGSSTVNAHLRSSTRRLYLPLLVMEDNSKVTLGLQDGGSGRWYQTLLGTVRVDASTSYPAVIQSWNYYASVQTNAATLVGSGALYYVSRNTGGVSASTDGTLVLTECSANGFKGPVKIGMLDGGTGRPRMHVTVNTADNIGGNPDAFLEKGLELAGIHLQVAGNLTLPENRGLYIATNTPSSRVSPQGPLVEVASGKTFTVPNVVGFQEDATAGCYTLSKSGAGTMKVPGWATNGTVSVTAGTLEITGASVSEGVVTPATIGSLDVSGGAVKVVVSGDGSELSLGDVKTLVDCGGTIGEGVADYIQLVNNGAFTLAAGTKAALSVDDGKIKMTVVEYVPEWTFNSNGGVYTNANVWTDETGTRRTSTAADAATKIEYFVPAGWTMKTPTGGTDPTLFEFAAAADSTLTIGSGGTLESDVMYLHVPHLVLKDNATLHMWIANNTSSAFRSARSVTGTLHIDASESSPAVIMSRAHFSDSVRTNAMDMVGSGGVYYTRSSAAGTDGVFWATGDNSGFTGPVAVKDATNKTDQKMFLHVKSSENIGGNPETYKEKGLELHSAQLCVHGDVALGQNRGFYVSSNSVVNVDSGKTFTSSNAVGFASGTTLAKTGAGTLDVPGWTNGTIAVNAGTLNLTGATFASGAATAKVDIGGIEYASGTTVKLTVTGDGAVLPFDNVTNVLIEAESALPAGFAEKVQIVNDNAFTVSAGLKTKLIVIDGTKLALEAKKRKGTMLIVR